MVTKTLQPKPQKRGRRAQRQGPAKPFFMRLPDHLRGPLKAYAGARGLSLNDVLVELIERAAKELPDWRTYVRLAEAAGGATQT